MGLFDKRDEPPRAINDHGSPLHQNELVVKAIARLSAPYKEANTVRHRLELAENLCKNNSGKENHSRHASPRQAHPFAVRAVDSALVRGTMAGPLGSMSWTGNHIRFANTSVSTQ